MINIFLNDKGFIEIKIVGHLVEDDTFEIGQKAINLFTKLEDEGKDIKVLVDSSNEEGWDDLSLSAFKIILKDPMYKKGAIFGSTATIKSNQEKIIEEVGLKDRVRIFDLRGEAEMWLNAKEGEKEVFINYHGWIEIRPFGDMTQERAYSVAKELDSLTKIIETEHRDVKILVDSSKSLDWTPEVYTLLKSLFSEIDYKKVATFGANETIAENQEKLVKELNIAHRARICKTRNEAEEWLAM